MKLYICVFHLGYTQWVGTSELSWGLTAIKAGKIKCSGIRELRWLMGQEVLNGVEMGRQGKGWDTRRDKEQ